MFSRRPENTAFGRDNLVLYFESDDLDAAFALVASKAPIIHPIKIQDWGGRVFRIYDPDGHIVEIGETDAPKERGRPPGSPNTRSGTVG